MRIKTVERDKHMHLTRALHCLIGTGVLSKRSEYFAFLTATEPGMSLAKRLRLAAEMAKEDKPGGSK